MAAAVSSETYRLTYLTFRGGIKSNVSPMIAEQYRSTKPYIRVLKTGERVIVDPAVTIQRIYMIFYLCKRTTLSAYPRDNATSFGQSTGATWLHSVTSA